jgi:hypothetical protein
MPLYVCLEPIFILHLKIGSATKILHAFPKSPMYTSCTSHDHRFHHCNNIGRSQGSSVSIMSDYRLDDQAIGVRSLEGTQDFLSNLCVQAGSETHPASCTMGTGGLFPRAKRGWGVTLTTHPHLVLRSGISRSYTSSPPKRLRGM